jgi:hypothetical protein
MATNFTSSTALPPYGTVTVDGTQYIERFQIYVTEQLITTPAQLFTNLRLTLPGTANFLLKGMTRDITDFSEQGSQDRRFRFRILNAEGSTWFFTGGLGMYDDRVSDNICFGNGQFPYPIIPPVPISATGTLIYEVEDNPINEPDDYPYLIHFGFAGCLLIPVALAADTQSIVYAA